MSGYRSTDDLNEFFDGIGGDDGFDDAPANPEIIDDADRRVHLVISPGDRQIEDERPPNYGSPFRSDWDAMVERHEKAAIGPNGQLVDDFDQNFQIKEAEHSALQSAAPFTRTNPPSVVNAILGSQVHVVTGVTVGGITPRGVAATAAFWQGEDAEARDVSIILVPVKQYLATTLAQLTIPFPLALIKFGTRAVQSVVEVDVGKGIQLTIPASSVVVDLVLEQVGSATSGIGAGATAAMDLTAMLSFGTVVRTAPITRTVPFLPLAAGANNVTVPPFAKGVRFVTNDSTVAVTLGFSDATAGGNFAYQFLFTAGSFMTVPVPISGEITFITVTQTAGNAGSRCALIFDLAI